jgi:hypothetical protein
MASVDSGEGQAAPAPVPAPRATVTHVIFDMDGLLLGIYLLACFLASRLLVLGLSIASWMAGFDSFSGIARLFLPYYLGIFVCPVLNVMVV